MYLFLQKRANLRYIRVRNAFFFQCFKINLKYLRTCLVFIVGFPFSIRVDSLSGIVFSLIQQSVSEIRLHPIGGRVGLDGF